jgi:hypothetical protein
VGARAHRLGLGIRLWHGLKKRKISGRKAWSLVLEFNSPPDEALCMITDVGFLSPDGPMRLLHVGRVFELFEGRRLVARGEVLEHS